jgi:hypothetical protein
MPTSTVKIPSTTKIQALKVEERMKRREKGEKRRERQFGKH